MAASIRYGSCHTIRQPDKRSKKTSSSHTHTCSQNTGVERLHRRQSGRKPYSCFPWNWSCSIPEPRETAKLLLLGSESTCSKPPSWGEQPRPSSSSFRPFGHVQPLRLFQSFPLAVCYLTSPTVDPYSRFCAGGEKISSLRPYYCDGSRRYHQRLRVPNWIGKGGGR